MQPEHRVGLEPVEEPLAHHHRRAAVFTLGRALLGRLEDEHHLSGEFVAHAGENLGHAHQDRDVRVVSACVHDAGRLSTELGRDLRRERHVRALGDGQCVHVGA